MAAYFNGNPEIQGADGLQTLLLMNPSYAQYDAPPQPQPSQQQPHSNFVFLNHAGGSSLSSPSAQLSHQQFLGVPLPNFSADPNEISAFHGLIPRMHYNLYNNIEHAPNLRDTPRAQQQGLCLTLSSQQQPGYASQGQAVSGGSGSSGSGVTNGVSGLHGVLLSSKYLKATQELLDEVVNVNSNGIKNDQLLSKKSSKSIEESSVAAASADGSGLNEAVDKNGTVPELSTAERQEIQMKKAKLASMLDEVEQRYRQYHHQMKIVISSFEQAAGVGAAKTYTALALQTISKQFRCLKDAITGQIRGANKSLGEEDSIGGKTEGSRLKFVDHHLRRQRALQHLGMIQQNAWRPQRGLPERSVSVLRAWLFEHFLHPYPKDSDKHILAKQTGLTRSQVSNWFINARVRLWKPMVEEMYLEEIKENEENGASDDKTSKSDRNEDSTSKSSPHQENNSAIEPKENHKQQNVHSMMGGNIRNQPAFSFIGSTELDDITQTSPKKLRTTEILHSPTNVQLMNMVDRPHGESNNEQVLMKFGNERHARDGYLFMGSQNNFIGGFGQYPIGEIGRFDSEPYTQRYSGNGVSLTLGLPHCENVSLSGPHHQTFLPNQNLGEENEFGAINGSHSSTTYEEMEMQSRKRFVAQLLPDFVA